MYLLKWLAVAATSPLWFPVVLFCVGFCILVIGSILVVSLFFSLLFVIWVMKLFYVTYVGLIDARKEVMKEIGNGLNSISWWRFIRLMINKHHKKLKEYAQYDDYKFGEKEEELDE